MKKKRIYPCIKRVSKIRCKNIGFAKPMVCMRGAFHENDGNHENDENDEDSSDSYGQGRESWISGNHGNHGHDENHGNPGCKPRVPQTAGLEIPQNKKKNPHQRNSSDIKIGCRVLRVPFGHFQRLEVLLW